MTLVKNLNHRIFLFVFWLSVLFPPPGCCGRMGNYTVVDTGQRLCYSGGFPIHPPRVGQAFFGQDAQYSRNPPSYRDNGDGTILDLNTGLTWQKTPDFKMRSFREAIIYAKSLKLGGQGDWRVPTIKELFSIADFRGNIIKRIPYIETRVFAFRYPRPSPFVRMIDGQYWSSTIYVGLVMADDLGAFGFNFADGRVKCYPIHIGYGRGQKTIFGKKNFVRCVRGPIYGKNHFVDNKDGTVSDQATGLMWTRADSGRAMNWGQALAFAENLNCAGYTDWRLPNVKELHTLVDYTRAPDARTSYTRAPAIDPIFQLTEKESWFWSSTTHAENLYGYYVCFGQAASQFVYKGRKMNAHGAGAVRSDPKWGDPRYFPNGHGPQGDQVRINLYVRCVRDIK